MAFFMATAFPRSSRHLMLTPQRRRQSRFSALWPQEIYCKTRRAQIAEPPMTYLLPPLNALRAFEAAARHLSFTLAAHELHVTPGAVAQQVRSLEAQLGLALFERLHRQLMLTPAGQAYLPPLRQSFGRIAEATDALRPKGARAVIRLGVHASHDLPLLHRIERFRSEQGDDVQVRISRPAGFRELVEGKVNLVIDRSLGHHPGYRCDRVASARNSERRPECADVLICPEGIADCPEIFALRDCLLAADALA
jgi:LysR family transcriptional regulator, glycine cleavage system transcriptional activator